MLNSQKISKNLHKIQKLWNEKGAYTVFKKGIHLSTKKLSQPPAKRTVVKRDSILNCLDKDVLRQDLELAFSSGLFRSISQIKKCIHRIPDEFAELILEEAIRTLKNEFYIYGNLKVTYGPDQFSWFRDPLTGFTWPKTRMDKHNRFQKPDGTDIKTVWEISRFQFLSSLAYAYVLTGDEKYNRFAIDKVSSWIDENPFLQRPHWWMPMEASIRILNWCVYLPLLDILKSADQSFRNRLTRSVFEHLIFIRYNLESSPSQAGNHYLADLVGLITARLLFPSVKWTIECTEFAIKEFQKEVNNQFKKEGIYFQGSLPYHRLGSEIMLGGAALTNKNGSHFTVETLDRFQQAENFTNYYTGACEKLPIIGDNDSGIFLKFFPGQESTNHRHRNCLFNSIMNNRSKPKNFKDFLCCIHFADSELPEVTENS